MSIAITFALLSLAAAGVLDVCFKRYSSKSRSRGVYLAICGATWAFLQMSYYWFKDIGLAVDAATLGYGASAGVCLALANLVFIESLSRLNVSLGSTIYRLNTVGVVILSVMVLGEAIGTFKGLGVIIAVVAVWMLYERPKGELIEGEVIFFLWMAVLASGLRAAFGVVAKAGLGAGADAETALLIYAISWIPAGLIYAAWRESDVRLTGPSIAYGIVTGLVLCLVANFLIAALELGEASIVIPIANLSFIVALMLSAALNMENLTWRKCQAVGLASVAIFFLAKA